MRSTRDCCNPMKAKIKNIKLLALDVDGIMTDGKIIYDSTGNEIKHFDVHDGFGLYLFKKAGMKVAIITARGSRVVVRRAKDLKIDAVYGDANPKLAAYKKMLRRFKVADRQVCFMGDDITDVQLLRRVGFSVTVPNGVPEAKKAADYITKKRGGSGAVREVIELILKTQKKWNKVLEPYER